MYSYASMVSWICFCIRSLLLHEVIVTAQGGCYYILKMSTRLRIFCHKVVMAMDLSSLAMLDCQKRESNEKKSYNAKLLGEIGGHVVIT